MNTAEKNTQSAWPDYGANDGGAISAQEAIAKLRSQCGTSSVARYFNNLSKQQKGMVLYGARLKPSTYINTRFDNFDRAQREAIRKAIVAVQDIASAFNRVNTTKENFALTSQPKVKPIQIKPLTPIDDHESDVSQFAAELAEQANALQ